MLQKLKRVSFVLSALAVVLSFGPVGIALAAQPPGTCLIHINGVTPPQQKCQDFIGDAAGHVDTDGNPLDYKMCYVVNGGSNGVDYILSDCSGNETPVKSGAAGVPGCVGYGCDVNTDKAATSGNCADISQCDFIANYVDPFINFGAAGIGLAVAISLTIGAVQYGSSGGDPQRVTAAKNRIRNSIIALLAFLFLYAMLNFLIPGGLL